MLKPYKRGTKLPKRLEPLYKRFNPSQKQIDAGANPWTDVMIDTDPSAVVIATGIDAAGRLQRIYSAEHAMRAKSEKFQRVKALLAEREDIRLQIESAINDPSTSRKDREAYLVAYLIFETGCRPGSTADTKAAKQAYGATTLQLRHVKPCARGVRLQFVGKKGVDQNILVTNPYLVELCLKRKQATTAYTTTLFDVSASHLRTIFKRLGSGDYSPKDFRTALGTSIALDILGSRKRWPRTKKGIKGIVNETLDTVAKKLGNTRAVAKDSYVCPSVLSEFVPSPTN